ncbi:mandelate racemase/muconate lactonizing enzyme family protein [Micromonospora globbae]|uniref:Mandelate racemase/muconate lactonizing enzyme family protein n=2 Tax=Micromonospora globbae TaxID=1894969 RepID=A0A420F8G6_9ACTN|nr:mandelate racemase/muconate lactonizing enzyme family protein [Micromonospora globbae]
MTANSNLGRRGFLGMAAAGAGGLSLAGLVAAPIEDQVAYASQKVSKTSSPSDLRITDMRTVTLRGVPFRSTIIRIDTNQGIYGLGEVRDDADRRYALLLKSRLLGQNPLNVEKLFKMLKQFGGHGRQGGGVSAVEMALWDIAGKAYGVPVYQLLGGKYRDKVRAYADAAVSTNPKTYAERLKARVKEGYTFLKMDLGIEMIQNVKGAFNGRNLWPGDLAQYNFTPGGYGATTHPFTRIQLTRKGLDAMADYVETVRDVVGYGVPIGHDHMGHFGINDQIKLAQRLEEYAPAYMEDVVAWMYTEQFKQFRAATNVPVMTGEDIYGLEPFKKLIDEQAVDIVHPDPATAGGILETKKIGDYAEEHGVPMFLHYAGSPVGAMAAVHIAAATQNFVALENHSFEVEGWDNIINGPAKPLVKDGFYTVPQGPGLGIELNEQEVKRRMDPDEGYFNPTLEWDKANSHDRIWS